MLMEGEIFWHANPVPLGEKEIRGILPISHLSEAKPLVKVLVRDLLQIISFYRELGTHAFNFSLFFDREGCDHGFSAFCTIIARINPNQLSMSDSSFMERLHLEPVNTHDARGVSEDVREWKGIESTMFTSSRIPYSMRIEWGQAEGLTRNPILSGDATEARVSGANSRFRRSRSVSYETSLPQERKKPESNLSEDHECYVAED